MKKLALILLCTAFVACKKEPEKKEIYPDSAIEKQTPQQLGQELFVGKGNCSSCHQLDTKSIGPSILEIAKIYKDKNLSIATFLEGNTEAVVDPTQFEVMKANFTITRSMTEDERKALEAYMISELK